MVRFFFFQAEDGIRDLTVTGVQTCALPICVPSVPPGYSTLAALRDSPTRASSRSAASALRPQIGRASCRERVEISVGAVSSKKKTQKNSGDTDKTEQRTIK